jgi:hypothetical protein
MRENERENSRERTVERERERENERKRESVVVVAAAPSRVLAAGDATLVSAFKTAAAIAVRNSKC